MTHKNQRWLVVCSSPRGLIIPASFAVMLVLAMFKGQALVSYIFMGAIFVYLGLMIYAATTRE